MEQTYHGTISGGTLRIDGEITLPNGTEVEVIVRPTRKGTPAAILAAVDAEPHLSIEDVNELLSVIRAHEQPVRYEDPFKGILDDLNDQEEQE